jgi:hypothetical protein
MHSFDGIASIAAGDLMLPLLGRTAIINAQAHFRIDPADPCHDATAALCQEASRMSTLAGIYRHFLHTECCIANEH